MIKPSDLTGEKVRMTKLARIAAIKKEIRRKVDRDIVTFSESLNEGRICWLNFDMQYFRGNMASIFQVLDSYVKAGWHILEREKSDSNYTMVFFICKNPIPANYSPYDEYVKNIPTKPAPKKSFWKRLWNY
jgi:hypothetical protein